MRKPTIKMADHREERGTCYVQLRRPDLAEVALSDALRQKLSLRRRGIVLTDLAMVGVQRRDLDRIVMYADAALDTARQTGSGVMPANSRAFGLIWARSSAKVACGRSTSRSWR